MQEGEKYDLLNPKTGELNLQGWEVNGEKYINDNSATCSKALYDSSVAIAKAREVNMFFI